MLKAVIMMRAVSVEAFFLTQERLSGIICVACCLQIQHINPDIAPLNTPRRMITRLAVLFKCADVTSFGKSFDALILRLEAAFF